MSTHVNENGFVGKVVTWFIVGILAIVALRIGLALAGIVLAVGFAAIFKLGPIVLVGWLVWKLLRYLTGEPRDVAI